MAGRVNSGATRRSSAGRRAASPALAGAGLDARSDALAERVKELTCLHSISDLLRGRLADLGEILQQVVDVLPGAWRHPEVACARITLKSRAYQSGRFRALRWRQQAEIVVAGARVGSIEIGYAEAPAGLPEPAFLPEEHALLQTVAERVAEIVALKETEAKLSTYQEHLRSLASELTLTEERERHRLALSLHDRIGQGLAVAKLKLETLRHVLPPEHASRLDDVAALIKQIVQDTRAITFEISPPILYELGLRPAVSWLAEHVGRQFGLPVEVRCDEEPVAMTEGVRVMLFRSIQELLTNTVKHARATRARVALRNAGTHLEAVVEDDGVGFLASSRAAYPSAAGGFGLFSIQERIGHLGGRVAIDSRPGGGTRISITVPGAAPARDRR